MKKMLLFGGGTWHDCPGCAKAIIPAFTPQVEVEFTEDPLKLAPQSLNRYDALSMYTCISADDEGLTDKSRAALPPETRRGVEDFVRNGKPFVPLHSTMTSFSDWSGLDEMLGIRWIWNISYHGPHETYRLRINRQHPLASRFEEFEIHDELYRKLKLIRPVDILMTVTADGEEHPHAWTTSYGKGRIFFFGPGHTPENLSKPEVQKLLANGLEWALGG